MKKYEFKYLSFSPGTNTDSAMEELVEAGEKGFQIVGTVNVGQPGNAIINIFLQKEKDVSSGKQRGLKRSN